MIDEKSRDANGFVPQPKGRQLVKVSGKIEGYSAVRDEASFVFTENDKAAMEIVAVSVALAGLGGQAIAVASNANSLEELADYVKFEIDGCKIKGWLWRSPFSNGDNVDVAAEWHGEHFELFGVSRPADGIIALYPHCSRSNKQHIKNAIKWWLILTVGLLAFIVISDYFMHKDLESVMNNWRKFFSEYFGGLWIVGIFAAFAVPVAHLAIKWMPFVKVAERVFKTLDHPDAQNINLVKSSKSQRTIHDPPELGAMYFKY